jgi:luciferase family oxidoreductase group 1
VKLDLGILCQSPVSEGMTPVEAVRNTVALAREAEVLGYERFWVAEHHSDVALASASPEVMVAHIASVTNRIRVGSAGVLLPFYSPFKVAEQFNLLAALFPDRVDLGVGRSGGSENHAPQALGVRAAGQASFAAFDELLGWLGQGTASRPFADTFASPRCDAPAQPWVLGTSPVSARYAAERGLRYAFGGFLDPRGLVPALQAYHQHFTPSRWLDRPSVNLGWYVQAAATEAEAVELSSSSEHWFVETFLRGRTAVFPTIEAARSARYSPTEDMAIAMRRQYALIGTGEQVVAGLRSLQQQFMVDAFTLVTLPHDFDAKVESYRLIAEANG